MRESQKKARRTYEAKALTKMTLKFHNENDRDILDKLNSVPNKIGYIRDLIRKDMAQNQ